MKKLLLMGCLLAAAGLVAADGGEQRRTDTDTYTSDQPVLQDGGAAVALPSEQAGTAPVSPIADLLAAHQAEMQALDQALMNARDEAERQSLELRAVEMKREHQRAELQALKADALLRQDAAYAARLDEALLHLSPAPAPVATTFVPRDPATGRALTTEGGAK